MELTTKPNLAAAQERWEAFWHHDIIDRPAVCITGLRWDHPTARPPRYFPVDVGDVVTYAEQAKAVV